MTWQPIETAPKDGRRFLAYAPEANFPVTLTRRDGTGWTCPDADNARSLHDRQTKVTHWMPLPEPPEQTDG